MKLFSEGKTQMAADRIVQRLTVSDPVRPGEPVSLQCSVPSGSQDKVCTGGHNVYWFKAGRDRTHVIYACGNDECEQNFGNEKSCIYNLSMSFNTSDAETYVCAVATCGEIWFQNGTKVDIQGTITDWGTMVYFAKMPVFYAEIFNTTT